MTPQEFVFSGILETRIYSGIRKKKVAAIWKVKLAKLR